jgi:hypothetical protein
MPERDRDKNALGQVPFLRNRDAIEILRGALVLAERMFSRDQNPEQASR